MPPEDQIWRNGSKGVSIDIIQAQSEGVVGW